MGTLSTLLDNITLNASGSANYRAGPEQEVVLFWNITGPVTGTSPTLVFTLQEVDPGDETTANGQSSTSAPITAAGTGQLVLSLITSPIIKVSWTVGGSSPSFGATRVTCVSKTVGNKGPIVADGADTTLGATTDADTALTVVGRLKKIVALLAGGLPAALVGGRLDVNTGSWLGSTAPSVGQKTSASSLPVVIANDQTVPVSSGATEEATFTVTALAVVLGNNKSLLSLYNPTASTKILKLREYYVRNAQTTAVTGVAAQLHIYRFASGSAPTGGTALTPYVHDTADTLGVGIDARTGGTIAGEVAAVADVMRISSDEWGPGTLDQEGAQQTISNYLPARVKRDAQQKPIAVLRPGQGVHLKCATNTTAGSFDLIFVFTQV